MMHRLNHKQIPSSFMNSTSNMQESIVLQGIPVRPEILSQVYESPNFFSGSVWIPGEIGDPVTISALSNFNKFLVLQRYDFFNGMIQADYIHLLQREVSAVPSPDLLAAKLNCMLTREYTNWYSYAKNMGMSVPKHDWYIQNFGSLVPSPNEHLYCEPFSVILIISIAVLSIGILWYKNRKKSRGSRFGCMPRGPYGQGDK